MGLEDGRVVVVASEESVSISGREFGDTPPRCGTHSRITARETNPKVTHLAGLFKLLPDPFVLLEMSMDISYENHADAFIARGLLGISRLLSKSHLTPHQSLMLYS